MQSFGENGKHDCLAKQVKQSSTPNWGIASKCGNLSGKNKRQREGNFNQRALAGAAAWVWGGAVEQRPDGRERGLQGRQQGVAFWIRERAPQEGLHVRERREPRARGSQYMKDGWGKILQKSFFPKALGRTTA